MGRASRPSIAVLKDFLRSPDYVQSLDLPYTASGGGGGGGAAWIHSNVASALFGAVIAMNAIVLAIETDLSEDPDEFHLVFFLFDSFFNCAFLLELVLRLRADRGLFFCDAWNIFDVMLVLTGVVDTWILTALGSTINVGFMSVMRTLRLVRLLKVLRIIRLIRFFRELMLLVTGIYSAVKSMVWGLTLLMLTIFLCALVLTRLLRSKGDDDASAQFYFDHFGTIPRTSFTLFMFTMEFQPDICMSTWDDGPWLTFFFVIYVAFTNITLLGVVTSVIVESILGKSAQGIDEHVQSIFFDIDHDSDGRLTMEDLSPHAPMHKVVSKALISAGITTDDARELFGVLDIDKSGCISRQEFVDGIIRVRAAPQAKHVLKLEAKVEKVDRKVDEIRGDVHMLERKIGQALSSLGSMSEGVALLQTSVCEAQAIRHQAHSSSSLDEVPPTLVLPADLQTPAPSGRQPVDCAPCDTPRAYLDSAGSGEAPSGMSRGSSSSLATCVHCGKLEHLCLRQRVQVTNGSDRCKLVESSLGNAGSQEREQTPQASSQTTVMPTSELQQLRSQMEELKGMFLATLQPTLATAVTTPRVVTATVELSAISSSARQKQTDVHASQQLSRESSWLPFQDSEGAGAHAAEVGRALRESDVARTTLEVLS